jgi:HSP20 family protein
MYRKGSAFALKALYQIWWFENPKLSKFSTSQNHKMPLKLISELHQLARDDFNGLPYKVLRRMPAMDLQETTDAFMITVDVPGFPKNAIEINAHGTALTIKGTAEDEKDSKDVNYHIKERNQTGFQRSVNLPIEIPADKITASLQNGVLAITIPKLETKIKRIAIKSKL